MRRIASTYLGVDAFFSSSFSLANWTRVLPPGLRLNPLGSDTFKDSILLEIVRRVEVVLREMPLIQRRYFRTWDPGQQL